ncbi:hypothetical protein ACS2OW_14905 [Bacillus cereus group sp. BceL035]|uniref:hypothetical protein n=1 Tax=Bacillus cereus group sp. BceL035 TaxID=3445193 RepID=UPI002AA5BA5A
MSLKYMIGGDIGTTSTKLVLFSIDGSVIARHSTYLFHLNLCLIILHFRESEPQHF